MGNGITGYIYVQTLESKPMILCLQTLSQEICFKKHYDEHTIKCIIITVSFLSTDSVKLK